MDKNLNRAEELHNEAEKLAESAFVNHQGISPTPSPR